MKKIKATLTALVMAFGVSAGLGTVAATVNPVEKSNVVAQAESITYTVNTLTAHDSLSSATLIRESLRVTGVIGTRW